MSLFFHSSLSFGLLSLGVLICAALTSPVSVSVSETTPAVLTYMKSSSQLRGGASNGGARKSRRKRAHVFSSTIGESDDPSEDDDDAQRRWRRHSLNLKGNLKGVRRAPLKVNGADAMAAADMATNLSWDEGRGENAECLRGETVRGEKEEGKSCMSRIPGGEFGGLAGGVL